jgi:hypothetical protein
LFFLFFLFCFVFFSFLLFFQNERLECPSFYPRIEGGPV